MTRPPLPAHEAERLLALARYAILDTAPERAFDELTLLAGHICAAPIALISLVDGQRQWFKSRVGLTATETARDVAFCAHAIGSPGTVMVVPDARLDPRFADNPLVINEPHVRFYAGAPLVTHDGHALGTLCIIDHEARVLRPEHRQALEVLATLVMTLVEVRATQQAMATTMVERDRAVQELKLAQATLEQRIVERTAELSAANQRLQAEIAGHRQAEEAVRLNQERYRLIAENTADVIWTMDLASERFTYVSPSVQRLRGYAAEEVMTQTLGMVLTPASLARIRESLPRRLAAFAAGADDVRVATDIVDQLRADGGIVTCEIVSTLLADAERRVHGILGVTRDITERQRIEIALRQSEEKYATAFSSSPDSINLNRLADGVYIDINDGFTAITGYRREEVVGRSSLPGDLSIWLHAEDRGRMVAMLRATGQVVGFEAPFRHRNGSVLTGLMSARIVTIDGQAVVLSITRDITERKQAEAALRAREEDLAITLHSIGDAVIATDAAGLITRMNRVAEALTGWSGAEAIGQPLGLVFRIVNAADRSTVENPVAKVLRLGEVVGLANHTLLIARDGRERQIADSAAPIRADGGAVRGVVLVFRDVTEQHLLEEQFHQAQKQQAIGHLAGGIAHDFNNMLGVVLGATEMLKGRSGRDPADARPLEMLTDAATRAADLTAKLLGFARRGKVRDVPVDLHREIGTVVAILDRTIDRRITIVTDCAARGALLHGDPSRIQNLLLNLCINARDAMPAGGTLTLSTRDVPADDPLLRQQGCAAVAHCALIIRDTGIGIPAWVMARLFEPFVTTKEPGKGTGLGLASVYGSVREHHGAISVESLPGQGTTFRLLFPSCRDGMPHPEETRPVQPADLHGQTVLVADDEELVRELLVLLLETLGAVVVQTGDGRQAVEIFSADPDRFSLVVLDQIMPGCNGQDAFRAIHALRPRTRVLISSGFTGDPMIGVLEQEGLAGFLAKPYTRAELMRQLTQLGTAPPAGDRR